MASSLFGATGTPVTTSQRPTDPMQIRSMLQQSSNPRSVIESLAGQGNPAAQAALSYLQNGASAQQAVMGLLQQRGIPLAAMLQNPLFK